MSWGGPDPGEARLAAAAAALRSGAVVGVPTDTVYGLAAFPWSEEGVARLFVVKGRPGIKPIPILVASAKQAAEVGVLDTRALEAAARYWPGPLTLVVARAADLPRWAGDPERGTVGVRVPAHPTTQALLALVGPLAVTSANRSGDPPTVDEPSARASLGDRVALYLPGWGAGEIASTVVDLSGAEPRVLREGPVVWGE